MGHTNRLDVCLTFAKCVSPTFSVEGAVAEGGKLRQPNSATDVQLHHASDTAIRTFCYFSL